MVKHEKVWDKQEFEKLCALQCTQEEICGWFGITDKTLDKCIKKEYGDESSFSEIFKQKKGVGKISLRRKMWKQADKSAAVAIFLAKNHLGMTDRQEIEHKADNVQITYVKVGEDD